MGLVVWGGGWRVRSTKGGRVRGKEKKKTTKKRGRTENIKEATGGQEDGGGAVTVLLPR